LTASHVSTWTKVVIIYERFLVVVAPELETKRFDSEPRKHVDEGRDEHQDEDSEEEEPPKESQPLLREVSGGN